MTYAELVALIQDYCENAETTFVANIPTFVRQAEQRIYRTVMLPEFRDTATLSATSGTQLVSRPADFLSVFSMAAISAAGQYTYLLDKDVNFMREAYPNPAVTGTPKYYGLFDGDVAGGEGNFILGPTPDADYQLELQYYRDPESIVTASTSWLGDNAATVLLYGTLIEAYTYMKGDADLMKTYLERYQEAMLQLGAVDARLKRDDYRDGRS